MPKTLTAPLTTEQAISRARRMIEQGQKLTQAADTVAGARGSEAVRAAETLKDERLLGYRVTTIPTELEPVLEALIAAAGVAGNP